MERFLIEKYATWSLVLHIGMLGGLLALHDGKETRPKITIPVEVHFNTPTPQKPAHHSVERLKDAARNKETITRKNDKIMPSLHEEDGGEVAHDAKNLGHEDKPFDPVRKTPQLMNKDAVRIAYPKRARQLLIEGIVHLRLTVAEDGYVTHVSIVSGPGFGLQDAAYKHAWKFIFLPATDDVGRPKQAVIDHEVVFRLRS